MSLEVIGAGFGRTGTLSLKAALEELGFVRCHHMREVAMHPAQADYWHDLSQGKAVDWDAVFHGYRASCDFPSSVYWEELHRHFPNSKVVLTVRDPERWYSSAAETIYPISALAPRWLGLVSSRARKGMEMIDAIVWNGLFEGRFEEKACALRVYEEHAARVAKGVAPERLLVFDVKEGWEPLCRFLDVPVPEHPFPHLNETASMLRVVRMVKLLRWAPWLLAGLALVGAVALL